MTPTERRALVILRDHGSLMAREFAMLMWPDAPGWKRVSRCGPNGSSTGGGMNLAGGAYIGRLRRKGWVAFADSRCYTHGLTGEGAKALREAEAA